MALLDLYNNAAATSEVGKIRDTVATVAAGDEGVNFFDLDDTDQKNFIERGFGDKVVTQSTEDDATNGNFTNKALLFYADHYTASPDKAIHLYYQRDSATWYKNKNATTKGITQSYKLA